jgi:hypothetical protein
MGQETVDLTALSRKHQAGLEGIADKPVETGFKSAMADPADSQDNGPSRNQACTVKDYETAANIAVLAVLETIFLAKDGDVYLKIYRAAETHFPLVDSPTRPR